MTATINEPSLELAQLRSAVDHVACGVVLSDAEGNLLYWNHAALRLHGYATVEEVKRHVTDFAKTFVFSTPNGKVLGVTDWPLPKMLRGEEIENYELWVERTDIKRKWFVSYSGARVNGSEGKDQLIVLTMHDMTARKEAENRLHNKETILRTMIDEIHDPVYIKNADGKFMFVNQAMARLGKRTTDEWIGKDSNEVFGPEIGNEALEMDKRAMESAYPFTYEKSSDAGGLMRHYLITKCRWLDGDGKVGGLVGISRDITSLKDAEQVVRDGERHVREVMDSLSVVVVVLNVDGRVYEMNRMAREIFAEEGLKTAQVIGTPLTSLQWFSASPEVRETMVHTISRAAEGQRIHLDNVALLHHGRAILYDVVLAPMHDQAGIVNHLILSAVDVSERKVAEEKSQEHQAQLAHLERVQTMGHMASGLAHELNQPLAAIVNYAGACRQIIAGGKAGMTDLDSVFGDILTEATRAGAIIRRLRGFVQKQRPQAVAVDINSLVNEAMRIFSYEFRAAQVVARQNLEANLPYVMADPVQITQVLVNLLRNAVDAMRDLDTGNKRLTVCTESIREGVRVLVVDSGIGIPQEQMGKLFDAFYTTKANGLGIGLALCRMIIENHGGQISGQTNPQGGMIFSFTLRHGEQSAGE